MSNLTNISFMYSYIPDNEEESDIFFFHTDHLGSTAYMTNKDGETCQFISYMPYGEAIIDEHNTDYENPFKFTGMELDPITGLYDHGARQRDPIYLNWLNPDPLTEKYPGVSPWSYCHANPIGWIDLNGEEPSPEEAARMAAHVYGDKSDDILIGGWKVSERDFGIRLTDEKTGLKSQIYERTVDGKTEYCYATAGTEDGTDWKENLKQPLGLSGQYKLAASNASIISSKLGKTELNFVGHSLGGGEAALNSLITRGDGLGRNAFTFNAAGVSGITKFLNGGLKTLFRLENKSINAYILKTDPLNKLQNTLSIMPNVNGKKHYLYPKDFPSVYNGHSINNIIKCYK